MIEVGALIADRYEVLAEVTSAPTHRELRVLDRDVEVELSLWWMAPELFPNAAARERFEAAAKAARGVRHPNLRRLFDSGVTDDSVFAIYQLADDDSAAIRPCIGRTADSDEVMRVATSLADALEAAHRAGLYHGWLTPDDLVEVGGQIKVGGVGLLAELDPKRAVERFGAKRRFIAPEVRDGEAATARADVFSMAIVLAELATGIEHPDPAEVGESLAEESLALADLMAHAAARVPARRPEGPKAFVERMQEIATDERIPTVERHFSMPAEALRDVTVPVETFEAEELNAIPELGGVRAPDHADEVIELVATDKRGDVPPLPPANSEDPTKEIVLNPDGTLGDAAEAVDESGADDEVPYEFEDKTVEIDSDVARALAASTEDPDAIAEMEGLDYTSQVELLDPSTVAAPSATGAVGPSDAAAPSSDVLSRPKTAHRPSRIDQRIAELEPVAPPLDDLGGPQPPTSSEPQPAAATASDGDRTSHSARGGHGARNGGDSSGEGAGEVDGNGDDASVGDSSGETASVVPQAAAAAQVAATSDSGVATSLARRRSPATFVLLAALALGFAAAIAFAVVKLLPKAGPAAESAQVRAPEPVPREPSSVVKELPVVAPVGPCPADMLLVDEPLLRAAKEPFCIDRREVSAGADGLPILVAEHEAAEAVCAARSARLCQASEWEDACRGPEGSAFPMGERFKPEVCNLRGTAIGAPGAYAGCQSASGALDMSGNAAEWDADGDIRGGSALDKTRGRCSEVRDPESVTRAVKGNPDVGVRCCTAPLAPTP